jgi:tryptophanyl-tRNA synthetase
VDLHALTVYQDPAQLRHNIRLMAATYIAAGIDGDKCAIFNQSMVPAHSELAWLLGCLTPMGWLNRMTQFKDKAGKRKEQAGLGLYAYPVLQAADILLYKATHVPIGEDQKQHLELARDIAGLFNRTYKVDYFPLPEPQIVDGVKRIMSLRDGKVKMSKSDPSEYSRILLTDDSDTIALKFRKAKTDPLPLPATKAELANRPEAENLVRIYSALTDKSEDEVCALYAGASFSTFKTALTEVVVTALEPIRLKLLALLEDIPHLDAILARGAVHAQNVAAPTIIEVKEMMGLLRLH